MGKVFDLQAQGPEFNPQDPHEKQGMVVYAWDSVPERWEQEGPWSLLVSLH